MNGRDTFDAAMARAEQDGDLLEQALVLSELARLAHAQGADEHPAGSRAEEALASLGVVRAV